MRLLVGHHSTLLGETPEVNTLASLDRPFSDNYSYRAVPLLTSQLQLQGCALEVEEGPGPHRVLPRPEFR